MPKALRWDKSLNVGIKVIDTQHKMLFDLANDLNTLIQRKAEIKLIDTLFSVTLNYAFHHFETEEEYIENDEDFSKHCYQHYQLLKRLQKYAVDYRNNRVALQSPGDFLHKWLVQHIKEDDIPILSGKENEQPVDKGFVDVEEFEDLEIDQRKYKRIRYDSVTDEPIIGHCYNATTLKAGSVNVVDLGGGGLKIYSDEEFDVDDLLIISCPIGKDFRLREKVRVMNVGEQVYGVEFVSPKKGTVEYLERLCAS